MEITVGYERKKRPDNFDYEFESEGASVYLKTQVGDEVSEPELAEITERLQTLHFAAKTRVLTELGIPFESNEHGDIVEITQAVQSVVSQIPGTTIVQQVQPANTPTAALPAPAPAVALPPTAFVPAAPAVAVAPPPGGALPVPPPAPAGKMSAADKVALYLQSPGEWYDNRGDEAAKPRSPIFRHKTRKEGQYALGLWRKDFTEAGYSI